MEFLTRQNADKTVQHGAWCGFGSGRVTRQKQHATRRGVVLQGCMSGGDPRPAAAADNDVSQAVRVSLTYQQTAAR